MEQHLWSTIAVFILGGIVKGASGIGLPQVTTPILANFAGVAFAVVVVSIPVLLTNAVQAFQGGYFKTSLRRFGFLAFFSVLGTLIGTKALASFSGSVLFLILGVALLIFIAYSLLRPSFRIPLHHEVRYAPWIGLVAGVLGGMTSISAPPLVMYLYCLGLTKEEFVSGISLIYVLSTIARIGGLVATGLLTQKLFVLSLLVCIPTALGFVVGQWVLKRVDQKVFFRFILVLLFFLAVIMLRRGLSAIL
ncbi:MAG TPA: sulfite exporter TauE/SafE family protein [bacterium]|nr:sulfite exporter TauE/SafE family protein [bacterium]